MKKIEFALISMCVLSFIFRLFNNHIGSIVLTFFFLALIAFYLFLSFAYFNDVTFKGLFKKSSYKGIKRIRIFSGILAGFMLALFNYSIFAILERIPGGFVTIYLFSIPMTALIIVFLIKAIKKSSFHSKAIFRLIPVFIISLFIFTLPRPTFIKLKHSEYPDYVDAYTKYMANPEDSTCYKNYIIEERRMNLPDEEFKEFMESKEYETIVEIHYSWEK